MCAKVLVVDDDQVNIDLLGYLLRAFGHEPMLSLTGEDAIRKARTHLPHLVVCDIQMPGLDGFEVLRRLRGDPNCEGMKIVGVTALAMVGDREKVLAAGFDGYMAKPITPETFVSDVERFLPASLIPSRKPTQEVAPEPRSAPKVTTSKGYVLVVDNVAANADLLHHLLGSVGIEVCAAKSVEEALEMATRRPPALIISDIHMPSKNGFDLLRAIRSDSALRKTRFFFASSSQPDGVERALALELGAERFLVQPFDLSMILEMVRACFEEDHA